MIDLTTPNGRIIAAAMRLAAERPWRDITLADIAEAAGMRLVEVRPHVSSKGAVLAAFSRAIDDEVLTKAHVRTANQPRRDVLFEVVMSRFDALAPYRPALRSIVGSGQPAPELCRSFVRSMHWMLQAAGIETSGVGGAVRLAGLGSVYASVMRTWLDDDDPGFARTMAALDRRLRSGERSLRTMDDLAGIANRLCGIIRPRRAGAGDPDPAQPGNAASPPPAAGPV